MKKDEKKKKELVTKLSLKPGKSEAISGAGTKAPKKKKVKKKKVKAKRPVGRPTKMTQVNQDEICFRLANDETLISICKSEHMPVYSNVMQFLLNGKNNKDFRDKYAHARQSQADFYADEILEIADEQDDDHKMTIYGLAVDNEAIQRSKLRCDARKWHASKTAPKKYGDKVFKEITGKDGAALIPDKYAKMSDEELLKSLNKKKCKLTDQK